MRTYFLFCIRWTCKNFHRKIKNFFTAPEIFPQQNWSTRPSAAHTRYFSWYTRLSRHTTKKNECRKISTITFHSLTTHKSHRQSWISAATGYRLVDRTTQCFDGEKCTRKKFAMCWGDAKLARVHFRILFLCFFGVMEKIIAWGRFKASDRARRSTGRTHARYSATSGCAASPRVVQKLAQNKLSIAFAAARHTLLTNRACPLCASAILIISSDLFFLFFVGVCVVELLA